MDLNATQTKLDTLGDYDDQVLGLKREVRLLTAEKNDMLVRINYLEPLYPLYRDYLPSYIRLAFYSAVCHHIHQKQGSVTTPLLSTCTLSLTYPHRGGNCSRSVSIANARQHHK